MFLIILMVILLVTGGTIAWYGFEECESTPSIFGSIIFLVGLVLAVYGIFTGFINYPASEGIHQGVITAVDREGYIFNHYKIYVKSGGMIQDGNKVISDETEYCLYLDESELANQLKEYVGKTVKVYYGHPGGKIGIRSCGTYHITKVELVEE